MSATSLDRSIALAELMADLFRHDEHGNTAPCLDPLHAHQWLSDDPAQTEAATHQCLTRCAAFAACETYINTWPETAGVWAGTTPTERNTPNAPPQ